MKFILFCNLPYSFAILKPIEKVLQENQDEILWYVPRDILDEFPFKNSPHTSSINDLKEYKADVIFVPGNEVPHFLRGLKVQIFHGLAGEKKGHFRIRDYFDLYLTQGPYFTDRFKTLAKKYKNFDVIQTGWCKLDNLFNISQEEYEKRKNYLKQYKKIILFAPTFSPSLTCAESAFEQIKKLLQDKSILVTCKFHDKMDMSIIDKYENLKDENFIISKEKDISSLLKIADIMISDTSSVVYEFLLLDKPVITINSISKHKDSWYNITNINELYNTFYKIITNDYLAEKRKEIIALYHPYNDGKSSCRMVEAVKKYLEKYQVPNERKISLLRKLKIYKNFG